jgi:translation initiation factor IF-2
MPQTIEAINHSKAANVPMIVAINKCYKQSADPDKVRTELLQHEVIVEKNVR